MMRSILISSFCDQYYVCFEGEPLIFTVELRNPPSNRAIKAPTPVRLTIREASGIDIGHGSRFIELP